MKNTNQNHPAENGAGSKKSLKGSREGFVDTSKGLTGLRKGVADNRKAVADIRQWFADNRKAVADIRKAVADHRQGFADNRKAVADIRKGFADNRKAGGIFLLALTRSDLDYIPGPDGDFDEWQKNYVKHLSAGWPPPEEGAPAPAAPVVLLYEYLGIPKDRYEELIGMQALWTKDYARGGKESDRRGSDTAAKTQTREEKYEPLLRSVTQEYILHNRKADKEIKTALKLTVPDTEPSTVHGSHLTTLAPAVSLKNMGGGKIDVRFSRPEDDNRANVPKGFAAELRYVIEIPLPPDPEDIPTKTTVISSKARFQIEAGMTNKKKTLRSYARWRHKINSAFHSPWTTVMEIDIV